MQLYLRSSVPGLLPLVLSFAMTACVIAGDIPPPCDCSAAVPLLGSDIDRISETLVSRAGRPSLDGSCGDSVNKMIAVSCSVSVPSDGLRLASAALHFSTNTCQWHNAEYENLELTNTSICLRRRSAPAVPEGCECARAQSLVERVYSVEQLQDVPGLTHQTIAASCSEDILIGGGCDTSYFDMFLTQSGLAEAASTWTCTASNLEQTSRQFAARAICVEPTKAGLAKETIPLADRVVLATQTTILPANYLMAFSVACEPGDDLISGSCTLDGDAPRSDEIALVEHGFDFDARDPDTWRCAWNNPTDATPSARATAICLRPNY